VTSQIDDIYLVTVAIPSALMTDIPPGINWASDIIEVSRGGDTKWIPFENRRVYTNAFVVQDGKVSVHTFDP
jgi:hypothetical protein